MATNLDPRQTTRRTSLPLIRHYEPDHARMIAALRLVLDPPPASTPTTTSGDTNTTAQTGGDAR